MNNKFRLWGASLLTILLISGTGIAVISNETIDDLKNVSSITWTPGEELSEMNRQFTGWTGSPPEGATVRSGEKLTIWLYPRGTSEEVCESIGVNCTRSDHSILLIQYGNDKGIGDEPSVSITDNTTVTVTYTITYRWNETVCSGGDDDDEGGGESGGGSNTGGWFASSSRIEQKRPVLRLYFDDGGSGDSGNDGGDGGDDGEGGGSSCTTVEHSETLSITETYTIPPIDPSCAYVLDKIEIVIQGLNQRIPANSSAFKNNYDLYLNATESDPVYGDKYFIKMKNFYYEIRKDEKHYYAIAKPLEAKDKVSSSQKIFPCDGENSLCSLNATLEYFKYYDAFGRPKITSKSSTTVVEGPDIGWNILIPTVIVGWLIYHVLTDKTLRLKR